MEPTPENHILLDTVVGVFDSSGGVLSSESTGVSIYLPPNAIPNGVNQEIYIKVGKWGCCTHYFVLCSSILTQLTGACLHYYMYYYGSITCTFGEANHCAACIRRLYF